MVHPLSVYDSCELKTTIAQLKMLPTRRPAGPGGPMAA